MNMQGPLLKSIKNVKTDSAGLYKGVLESEERCGKQDSQDNPHWKGEMWERLKDERIF